MRKKDVLLLQCTYSTVHCINKLMKVVSASLFLKIG